MLLNRERADAVMDRRGLDALVASTISNVYYLTGWATDGSWGFGDIVAAVLPRDHERSPAVIVVRPDAVQAQQGDGPWAPVRLFGPDPYRLEARAANGATASATTANGASHEDGPAHPAALGSEQLADTPEVIGATRLEGVRAHLGGEGLLGGRIGFDDLAFGRDVAEGFGLEVVAALDVFREVRLVKTAEEVELIEAASRKTRVALEVTIEAIAAGATCKEAERAFWSTLPLMGAQPLFLLINPFRPGSGKLARDAVLRRGDMVTFDATACCTHYCSDLGRTAVLGAPRPDQLDAMEAIRRGWEDIRPIVRPGTRSSEIRRSLVEAVRRNGLAAFNSGGVHSVGLEHTDHPHPPSSTDSSFVLEEGMVLSIDMPFMDVALGRFHNEELVLVGADGSRPLGDTDNRLYCIDGGRISRLDRAAAGVA